MADDPLIAVAVEQVAQKLEAILLAQSKKLAQSNDDSLLLRDMQAALEAGLDRHIRFAAGNIVIAAEGSWQDGSGILKNALELAMFSWIKELRQSGKVPPRS